MSPTRCENEPPGKGDRSLSLPLYGPKLARQAESPPSDKTRSDGKKSLSPLLYRGGWRPMRSHPEYEIGVETDPLGLAQPWMIVAEAYKKEFAPTRSVYTVLSEVCKDEYSQEGRSLAIVILKPETPRTPTNPGSFEEFKAHLRLVLGGRSMETGVKPIQAWDIMMPSFDWEIYLTLEGLRPDEIGEVGHFAFAADVGILQQIKLTRDLIEEASDLALRNRLKRIFAIMSSGMAALCEKAGEKPTLIPGAKLLGNKKVRRLKENYPSYWANADPKKQPRLYYWDVEESITA